MSKIKLFSVYYSRSNLNYKKTIKTDVIEPIQTGKDSTNFDLAMLSDNEGDNISRKNPYYGEMTCWYWVWKNYIKTHPEVEYIGFTQYRRLPVLIPERKGDDKGHYLKLVSKDDFDTITKKFTEDNIYKTVAPYDLIVTKKWNTLVTTRWEFTSFLPPFEWINARESFIKGEESEREWFNTVMERRSARYKCNFIMKRELFEEFASWLFERLFYYESKSAWKDEYPPKKENARIAAFITECFMNLWIEKQLLNKDIKVKEVNLYEEKIKEKLTYDNIQRLKWFFTFPKHLNNVRIAKKILTPKH